jgi:cysteinyl-tRNA synthetase
MGDALAAGPTKATIEQLIAARQAARAARDFARADALRQELVALGIGIEDSAVGTTWHRLHAEAVA